MTTRLHVEKRIYTVFEARLPCLGADAIVRCVKCENTPARDRCGSGLGPSWASWPGDGLK
jgi:hypothetical protein